MSLALLAAAASAAVLCPAPQVHDGDGLRCNGEKIRIANIDAPEVIGSPKCHGPRRPRSAWCDYALGEQARQALAGVLSGRKVTFVRTGTDRYGRTLALVYADGINVGAWLVDRGLARPWR